MTRTDDKWEYLQRFGVYTFFREIKIVKGSELRSDYLSNAFFPLLATRQVWLWRWWLCHFERGMWLVQFPQLSLSLSLFLSPHPFLSHSLSAKCIKGHIISFQSICHTQTRSINNVWRPKTGGIINIWLHDLPIRLWGFSKFLVGNSVCF